MSTIDGTSQASKAGPALELDHVTRAFVGHVAVDDVSLTVAQGEFVTLLGPSGCGKTTILRMVAGFDKPSQGRILVGGNPVAGVPPYRRPIGIVFQNLALFPHMTVEQNIAFGLEAQRIARKEIRARIADALVLMGLQGLGTRRVHQISGGQRQRVALARALVTRPTVLLLDEPLGALDLKIRRQLQIELKRIQRQVGTTFVFVTHDQEEALTMSDRIAVMNGGRIEQIGPPAEIYNRPQTAFVARFIGDTNLLTGQVRGLANGIATVELDDTERTIVEADATSADVQAGRRASIIVRPESVRIATAADTSPGLSAKVEEVVYAGAFLRYRLGTTAGELIVNVPVAPSSMSPLPIGAVIRAQWAARDATILPEQS